MYMGDGIGEEYLEPAYYAATDMGAVIWKGDEVVKPKILEVEDFFCSVNMTDPPPYVPFSLFPVLYASSSKIRTYKYSVRFCVWWVG